MSKRTRYAQVGLGQRAEMFQQAVLETFAASCEIAGYCDSNPGRVQRAVDVACRSGTQVPGYTHQDFDQMLAETRPDCVIVTTRDCFHDDYICRAMELGCDVITEKPMTTDAAKCARILETQKRTGQRVTVTFNYRYSPPRTQLKELLMSGVIGDVLSIDFHWLLDTSHGADYYRRWHRNKANSGGLLVHKATHHFDLVNWWLSTVPERVYANGKREFYTPATAERYGLSQRAERCHGCPESQRCPFCLDLAGNANLRSLYLDQEHYDGYYRDGCVFSADIDIEDTMNVVVEYRSGATLSYSLNGFMPWEGHLVSFNGTRGRIEHKCEETVYVSGDGTVPGALKREGSWTRIYPHWGPAYEVPLWEAEGGHGGADPVMLRYIFDPENQPTDKYMRASDQRAGAWSIMTGVAANRSMAEGRPVRIGELVAGIDQPDYPTMPSRGEQLPRPG
jgi:predicted dehydrogenase